jgi:nitrite reductase (NADH) small subunit
MSDVWIRVTSCDSIPPREGRAVSVGGREIAIFNLGPAAELGAGDRFFAVDNRCPHKAGPLADGIVTGTSVVCPLHTWKVSLVSGAVERPASAEADGVTTYPVRVDAGVVVVGVPKLQDCRSTEPLLHERSLDPPCRDADGCVSSMPTCPSP